MVFGFAPETLVKVAAREIDVRRKKSGGGGSVALKRVETPRGRKRRAGGIIFKSIMVCSVISPRRLGDVGGSCRPL
jgi:hypothetical protein